MSLLFEESPSVRSLFRCLLEEIKDQHRPDDGIEYANQVLRDIVTCPKCADQV